MSKRTDTPTLDDAVQAARSLSAEAQDVLAMEIMESIEDLNPPERPTDRQAVIIDRLSRPLAAISRDELMTILRQYNPAL